MHLLLFSISKHMLSYSWDSNCKQFKLIGGGEFRAFTDFLFSNGITHRTSCPHTHEQNGMAERKHRHIVETGLTLLAQSSMPFKYWDEAFRTSVFLINRLPTPLLNHKTPLEVLFHKQPGYSQLRVFGCACYPNIRPYNKHKFQFKSKPCTFLSYSLNHKGYKCLDASGRIFISRDVIFDEFHFPFTKTNAGLSSYSSCHTSNDWLSNPSQVTVLPNTQICPSSSHLSKFTSSSS